MGFALNGETVSIKALTLGDLKAMQKISNNVDDIDLPFELIAYCTGLSVDELDALPLACVEEISVISEAITKIVTGG